MYIYIHVDLYELVNMCVCVFYVSGQKAAIALSVSDGEHFFVSGSKDKTVKVWNLRSQGAGSAAMAPQLTYTGHQKALVAVELLEEIDMVVSCDGALHVSPVLW